MTQQTVGRKVVKGESVYRDSVRWYAITFSDGLVAETDSLEVAKRLQGYIAAKTDVEVATERLASGQTLIVECTVIAPRPESVTPAAPTVPLAPPPPPAVKPPTTALAKAEPIPTGLIVNPDTLTKQLEHMQQQYHVLSPAIAVSQFAEGFGANLAVVKIDPTVEFSSNRKSAIGAHTYYSSTIHGGDERKRSLNKQGLQMIAQAMGIQWHRPECKRMDDGKERNYWRWQYSGYIRTHDGQLQPVFGDRELDLRDGSSEAAGMSSPAQLQKARAVGNEVCETKAMQRAIRTFVKQAYTEDELKKPFLIVRFSFTPDMKDPEIKKLVTQNAMAGIGALYHTPPAATLPMLPPPSDDPDPFADRPTPSSDLPQTSPAATTPAVQWPEGARFIADAKVKREGTGAKGAWKLYEVAAQGGEYWTTFSASLYDTCAQAKAKGLPVMVELEESDPEKYPGQMTLKAARICDPAEPPLPFTTAPGGY